MILQNKIIRGYPFMNKTSKSIIRMLGAFLMVCALTANVGCVDSGTASKVGEVSKSEDKAEPTTQAKYKAGDIVETKSMRISYLSCGEYTSYDEFSKPKDGNKVIFCEFEFENISDSDKLASSFDFSCFADNNSCEEYIWSNDNLSATLSAGRKAKGKIYFEVPKNASDIEIEYDSDWLSSSKIIFLYS